MAAGDDFSCPSVRNRLKASMPHSSTTLFTQSLPEGSCSMSRSLFSSLWNCSLVPWSW